MPIELYLSEDRGFEYGTYVCLVENEFLTAAEKTIAWCNLDYLPKQLHGGLKTTLNNQVIRTKIETIMELEIGVVGGEEDGIEAKHDAKLYSTPEDAILTAETLGLGERGRYMLAATFGNVHGVYKPGNEVYRDWETDRKSVV